MWFYVVVFLVALVLAFAFQPKPPDNNQAAGTFTATTAAEGGSIQVIFGTVLIQNPNITWYGDIDAEPIKSSG